MKIEVIRQKRKSIVLKLINSDKAILKVPYRLDDNKVQQFIDSKRNWLTKNSCKLKENEEVSQKFDLEKFIYFNGKAFCKTNEIALDFDKRSNECKKLFVQEFYLKHFYKLKLLVDEISQKTGLKFSEVKPTSSIRVWGSFNDKKVMKLNWKLLILPQALVNYVICHELCHGLHMNHKPQFWADVEKICPEYKLLRKELSKFSFVLKTKF